MNIHICFNWKCLEQVGTHLNYFSINQLTRIFYYTTTDKIFLLTKLGI